MNSYECTTCGKWVFFEGHKCPPPFKVRHVWPNGDREDWRTFYATDEEEAAEKWGERYDSDGDYTIVGGSAATVEVMNADEEVKVFTVSGEHVPQYRAQEEKATDAVPSTRANRESK